MTENNRNWSCALTGHRKLAADFRTEELSAKLEELLELRCTKFLCGMARGFDLTALSCLVKLREKYKFEIEACIPYAGHEMSFSAEERKLYEAGLACCDQKTVILGAYHPGCFFARNRYMVEHADAVLAYCKRDQGGTAYTAEYALKKGVPVIFLN